MRVLVCGGRDFDDQTLLYETLDALDRIYCFTLVINGAARGADSLAHRWAQDRYIEARSFPADWEKHGKAAGPIRNQKMLDEGKPSLVVAFPGGRGTADMIARARQAGIAVHEIRQPPTAPPN
jgi:hypothetical protein